MTTERSSPASIPGNVSRVGLLVPSSNTVMEVDFYRHLPGSVTVHTGRMYLETTTPEHESIMLDQHALPAARDVGTARPHVIVFGCTSAGALRGNAYDAELCERIHHETGAETISVIASVRRAIARRGGQRIGIITPYVDSLNEKIRASVEADGVDVAGIYGLGITENFAIAEVTPERIAAFAKDRFGAEDIDLLFASCTNFRAVEAIPLMEEDLAVPIVTSNQATLEAVLQRFGLDRPVSLGAR